MASCEIPVLIVEGPSDIKRLSKVADKFILGWRGLFRMESAGGKEHIPKIAADWRKCCPTIRIAALFDGDQRFLQKQRDFFPKLATLNVSVTYLRQLDILKAKDFELVPVIQQIVAYLLEHNMPYDYRHLVDCADVEWIEKFIVTRFLSKDYPQAEFWGFLEEGFWHLNIGTKKAALLYEDGCQGSSDNIVAVSGKTAAFVTSDRSTRLHLFKDNTPVVPISGFDPGIGSIRHIVVSPSEDEVFLQVWDRCYVFDLSSHTVKECENVTGANLVNNIAHKRIPRSFIPNDNHWYLADQRDNPYLFYCSSNGFIGSYQFVNG